MNKTIFVFGNGKADGNANDKNILGGKGANLAEMTHIGIPVPPGFTISTEVGTYFMKNNTYPLQFKSDVKKGLKFVEKNMNQIFGDSDNPLLISIRSGARQSMPGMMETVLNIGLTEKTIPGLIQKSGNSRFVYDAYRRLITMYSDVVMEKGNSNLATVKDGIREQLEQIMLNLKNKKGIKHDTELSSEDLSQLCKLYKKKIFEVLGEEFPDDPFLQLWGGIGAVFSSWNGKRAIKYRKIENIPNEWGTAVNVQAMVFGNMGDSSATGVAFTRNPATGENKFYGEWMVNAQGEDVVAGIRTPNPLNENSKTSESSNLISLEQANPKIYSELLVYREKLEKHYRDMQDIEFTIQDDILWMLQTRTGKRNGGASIRIAIEMYENEEISKEEAILRISPEQLDEIMHPMIDPEAEKLSEIITKGLPAGPGGGCGQIVFTADDAEQWAKTGKKVILVRTETSPEDVHGMHVAEAVLTARGGMTSHAALVARGWGKCCIVGCNEICIDNDNKSFSINNKILKEGDWISLNGSNGNVYNGKINLIFPDLDQNIYYKKLMKLTDEIKKLTIRTNADSPKDAIQARKFGAEGIGLCRTEHMFFAPERIINIRKMILADSKEGRKIALSKLLPFQKSDFKGILSAMSPFPVTIRLLDPPLHEFINLNNSQIKKLAFDLSISEEKVKERIESLHESNPMLGHRGCRLGIAFPEITKMQAQAIFEATAELISEGIQVFPEVMIPLVGIYSELEHQRKVVEKMAIKIQNKLNVKFKYQIGTMIELPRACMTADEIANHADFFSFGTNDLTQMTYGYSRDDVNGFLPLYIDNSIIDVDPFQSLDQKGVGNLIIEAIKKGRKTKSNLKIGICGEHGGDPKSIQFFNNVGLDYVSCSPFRVPIARLSAGHSEIMNK
ncbi:MAG: pyruvate, phosphate dikinase [Candidatus Marinimicrobia bacterium]|nr:pyruvate, phosphate dikinase [Candidatus Neomarinimicrobiota bacterium]